mgnify:CR=1 FL=1
MLANAHNAYTRANSQEERLLNQGLFANIWVYDEHVQAHHAEPFQQLLHPALQAHLTQANHPEDNKKLAPGGASLKENDLVRSERLELSLART